MSLQNNIKIRQRDITDCGAACLSSVAAFYKLKLPVSRIRQYAGTDKRGTNVLGLIEAAELLGFQAKGVKGTFESLSKIPTPSIAHVVIDEKLEELREATHDDVGGILQLIEPFENDGTLVKRDRTEIERDVDHYTIIEHDGVIFACAALYPYPEAKTAEMAALTVSPQSQGQGDGEKILKRIEQRARAMGLQSIFVLTTRTMHWFIKRGFVQMDPDWLPEARKRKYNWDRRSQVLMKKLS